MVNIAGQMEPDPQINATAEAEEKLNRDMLTAINEKSTGNNANNTGVRESENSYQIFPNEILSP